MALLSLINSLFILLFSIVLPCSVRSFFSHSDVSGKAKTTEMKPINIITALIFIYLFSKTSFGQNADHWTSYIEKVNTGITLRFLYPDNTKVNSDENSRCISTKNGKINIDWCIWMSDSSEISVKQSIIDEKASFKGQTSIQTDSILIENIKCLRVTFKSNLKTDPFKQIVFLTRLGTTLEIINSSGVNSDFDKFCSTINVTKTEEKPSR